MAVPSWPSFVEPQLRFLGAHREPVRRTEIVRATVERMQFTEEELSETVGARGQSRAEQRAAWALTYASMAGLVESPQRSLWQLSTNGHALLARSPRGLSQEDLRKIKRVREETASDNPLKSSLNDTETLPDAADERTPDERLRQAYEEIRQTQRLDILRALRAVAPARFEAIVLEVLHKLGYGQTRKHLQKTGAGADGGIDGIISLDRLGLEKVYIQAKRYAEDNPVSRPAIQAFLGALSERRASKGVFITTSRFSKDARDCAARASDSLVLLDGDELSDIMLDYQVGVSVRETLTLVSIDSDFFEDDYDTLG